MLYQQYKKVQANKKYRYYIMAGIIILFIVFFSFCSFSGTTYSLPASITFAGQKVPLDDQKTYERIDTAFQILVQDQRGQITLWLKRFNKYQPIIKNILDEEKVNEDFFYLAVQESSLLPCTTSSAQAKGWWQFIEGTATRFGLTINEFVDERCDLVRSTHAAAQYLKTLLGEAYFKGDVFAAMAAYNFGETNVLHVLNAQGNFQQNHGYFSSFVNTENSLYIPRIIALKVILQNPEEYGFETYRDYTPWKLETYLLQPKDNINIKDLCKQADLDFLDFVSFNP
ncbi:MAG: lytic transglycosylase domain-containing protein, partial [Bacteroidota bacterium]